METKLNEELIQCGKAKKCSKWNQGLRSRPDGVLKFLRLVLRGLNCKLKTEFKIKLGWNLKGNNGGKWDLCWQMENWVQAIIAELWECQCECNDIIEAHEGSAQESSLWPTPREVTEEQKCLQSQTIGEISLRASNGVRESNYVFKHQDTQYITMMTVKWGRKATHKEGRNPASCGFRYL